MGKTGSIRSPRIYMLELELLFGFREFIKTEAYSNNLHGGI